MAVKGQEVEGITGGIEANSTVRGAFNQNMLFRRMSVETRDGFGQVAEFDTTMNAIIWRKYPGTSLAPTTVTPDPTRLWGYKNHLGSHLMNTSFGSKQIISVFSANVLTGDRQLEPLTDGVFDGQAPSSISEFASIYIVSIYDTSTGQRWEEPIYDHTSSFSKDGALEMPYWHGTYESSYEQKYEYSTTFPGRWLGGEFNLQADQQKWVNAPEPDDGFYFTEMDDTLYFGNKHTGLLAYIPAKFRGRWLGNGATNSAGTMRQSRSMQANTVDALTWRDTYSESSVVIDAIAVDGAYSAGFTYMNQTEFPKPLGAANIDGRLVMFEGNNVYFSDPIYPTSVIAENILFVPSEERITGVAEHTGNLLIFTRNEVWYFRPTPALIVADGSLIKLSDGIGCISLNSICKANGSVFWMDERGCYKMGGSLAVETVSGPIKPFFDDFITNPITNYYTLLGNMPAAASMKEQASMRLAFNPALMSSTYYPKLELLAFCMPHLGGALTLTADGKWGWWSFESNVAQDYNSGTDTFSNAIGVSKNIRNPWVVSDNSEMFLISSYNSTEVGERVNQIGYVGTGDDRQTISRPYSILRYGTGGSVDRSVEFGEDRRSLSGNWRSIDEGEGSSLTPSNTDHYLYLGKPIPIPANTTIGDAGAAAAAKSDAVPNGSFWLPVEIVPGNVNSAGNQTHYYLNALSLIFTFESSLWETIPVASGNTTAVPLYFLPPERQRGEASVKTGGSSYWSVTKPAANTVSVAFAGGAAASVGDITVFNHFVLNANKRQRNRLVYIPFRPKLYSGKYKAAQGLGINITTKTVRAITGPAPTLDGAVDCRAYIWEETFLGEAEKGDNQQAVYSGTSIYPDRLLVAQPIDWAYKTRPVADGDKVQIKGRGLRIVGLSRGAGVDRLTSGWPTGILNTISGADYKEWSSQVVDIIPTDNASNTNQEHPAVILSANKTSVRNRIKDSSTGSLVPATFNQGNGPKWSADGGTTATYSYITDEEEASLLDISDGIRGQSISYMLWGHLQNKAEKVAIYSAKIVLRILGGVRRKGR